MSFVSDSRSAGYLAPLSIDHPQNDGDLDAIIQAWVRDMTGLPGDLVRPRWQSTPPPAPPQDVNWVSLGCQQQVLNDYHYMGQVDADTALLQRHETMEYLFTWYGANASGLSIGFRDRAMVTQNRDYIESFGIKLMHIGNANNTPLLVNEVYRPRCDQPVHFRRQIDTLFPIKSLLSAPFVIHNNPF